MNTKNERLVMKILCSRPKNAHVLGRLVVDEQGYRLDFKAAGIGVGEDLSKVETVGVDQSQRRGGVNDGRLAWCSACELRLPVPPMEQLIASAERGTRQWHLQAEGMYKDPLRVFRRRDRRRGC